MASAGGAGRIHTMTTTVAHCARSDACNVCMSRPEGAARTQNSQHHAEDGHTGRDGPRRDGLGTPCDAARLTVLRASQQQECIPPLHPDLQEQSPPDCQPASRPASKAPQRWRRVSLCPLVHPATAGSALLSLQSSPPTRRAPGGQHAESLHSGRPLGPKFMTALMNKSTRRPTHRWLLLQSLLYAVHSPAVPAKFC